MRPEKKADLGLRSVYEHGEWGLKLEFRDRKSEVRRQLAVMLSVICYTDDLFLGVDAKASMIFSISTVSTNYLILQFSNFQIRNPQSEIRNLQCNWLAGQGD